MIDKATIQRVMDATDIVDVVKDFVTLRKNEPTTKDYARFIMSVPHLSAYHLLANFVNASHAVKAEMQYISSWNSNI